MSRLKRSAQAIDDLAEIWLHIAEDNIEAADRFAERVEEVSRRLARSPFLGRRRPELAEDIRSFPIGSCLVFYRPVADGIEIARVLSGSRDIGPDYFAPGQEDGGANQGEGG